MFTKSDIRVWRNRNRFLIRNGDHIGVYKYIDGYMMLKIRFTKDIEGFDEVYKVYDTYEDKVNNTLLRFSHNEPTNTLKDLLMVSEIYEIPSYVSLLIEEDVEAMQIALNSDDFYETLRNCIINR